VTVNNHTSERRKAHQAEQSDSRKNDRRESIIPIHDRGIYPAKGDILLETLLYVSITSPIEVRESVNQITP